MKTKLTFVLLMALLAFTGCKREEADTPRNTAAKADISSIGNALDMFEVDTGIYPKSLDALINAPTNAQNWRGPYLPNGVPHDPWGKPYFYEYPGKHNPNRFDLWSAGSDGQSGTRDDIANWDVNH